jgi:hypothetical protein
MKKVYETVLKIGARFFVGLLMAGCLSPIDLAVDKFEGSGNIIIGGQISTLSDRNYVEIGISSADGHLPDPVSGAFVVLTDNIGNTYAFQENNSKSGRYDLPNVNGISGLKYQIEVTLPNGKTYKSKVETMPLAVGMDALHHNYVTEEFIDFEGALIQGTFLKIHTKPTFPNIKPYLCRWVVEEVYQISPVDFPDPFGSVPPDCFVTQIADAQKAALFDGREFSSQLSSDVLLASKQIDQTFHYKHYFTVYQSAITAESFDYWSKINVLANQVGSIFDTPPAELIGNISNSDSPNEKVYGYFQATAQTFSRFYVIRADLPENSWLQPYCEYEPGRDYYEDYPLPCQNCLNIRGSSLTRPDWF